MPTFTKRGKTAARPGRTRTFHSRSKTRFPVMKTAETKRESRREAQAPREVPETAVQLDEINRLIKQSSARLSDREEREVETHEEPTPSVREEPISFNGVSSGEEKTDLLQAELAAERRRAAQLKHQLELIESEFQKEKGHLDKQVHELKKEMHRTVPIQDSKFFSLSRELRSAVDAIHSLQDEFTEPLATSSQGMIPTMVEPLTPAAPVTPPPALTQPVAPAAPPQPTPERIVEKPPIESAPKKKKLMITGGAAVAILLVLTTGLSMKLTSTVDQVTGPTPAPQAQTGQVQGVSTAAPAQTQEQRFALSQAEVAYDQTTWETVQEPIIGVKVESPANAINIIKTDSSLTFIRKTGYIFKIQKIETGLELKDYWKQIQATSLNYTVSEVLFKNKKALFLELSDTTDYPGNRYLVKEDNYIFDVWYALPSSKFDDDDVKRAERMLSSLQFTL